MRTADRVRTWVPRWWAGEGGVAGDALSLLLAPAEFAFRGSLAVRNRLFDWGVLGSEAAPIPVISVGNIAVGGTGKTPIAAWLAGRLQAGGRSPAVVSRGYGRDEIAVHEELNPSVPVFVAARRARAVAAAARAGSDCAVLDDGFQHRSLRRDFDIVLIAAEHWGAPQRLLPRGPWRESLASLRRADFVLVTRKSADAACGNVVADRLVSRGLAEQVGVAHVATTQLVPLDSPKAPADPGDFLRGRSILVVTAIADPGPLLAEVRRAGAEAEFLGYPDHYEFAPADVRRIRARAAGRPVVVTRKEAVKLRRLSDLPPVYVLDQEVRMERGEQELEAALRRALAAQE